MYVRGKKFVTDRVLRAFFIVLNNSIGLRNTVRPSGSNIMAIDSDSYGVMWGRWYCNSLEGCFVYDTLIFESIAAGTMLNGPRAYTVMSEISWSLVANATFVVPWGIANCQFQEILMDQFSSHFWTHCNAVGDLSIHMIVEIWGDDDSSISADSNGSFLRNPLTPIYSLLMNLHPCSWFSSLSGTNTLRES